MFCHLDSIDAPVSNFNDVKSDTEALQDIKRLNASRMGWEMVTGWVWAWWSLVW